MFCYVVFVLFLFYHFSFQRHNCYYSSFITSLPLYPCPGLSESALPRQSILCLGRLGREADLHVTSTNLMLDFFENFSQNSTFVLVTCRSTSLPSRPKPSVDCLGSTDSESLASTSLLNRPWNGQLILDSEKILAII